MVDPLKPLLWIKEIETWENFILVHFDMTFLTTLASGIDVGPTFKGMFLSEGTDVLVITPNRRTLFCPETENLNFGD
jgi:hypothetical protein